MASRRGDVGASSSRGPRINTMGLQNLNDEHKQRWARLTRPGRVIQETKFAHWNTLADLGLLQPVQTLLNKVGLGDFLNYSAFTYERYTLEFLSTLSKGYDDDGPYISFHLNDEYHLMYYQEMLEAFGWDYYSNDDFLTPGVFNADTFYAKITNGQPWHPRVKSSSLPHPALRFIHRFLSMTVFCRGEPTHLPRSDLRYLWTMTPEGVGCPDWLSIFVENCLDIAAKERGKISMGGMVTLLAEYRRIEVPVDDKGNPVLIQLGQIPQHWPRVFPSNVYDLEQLRNQNMLWISPRDQTHMVWLFGAHKVRYIVLPQHARTQITPATTTEQLFVSPDDQYRGGVAEELGEEVAQLHQHAHEEPMEEDHRQPHPQPQPHQPPQQHQQQHHQQPFHDYTEDDPYQPPVWHTMLDARMTSFEAAQDQIDMRLVGMQSQIDAMEDNMYSMSSMVSAMNNFYISHYPTYHDPSQEIERRRQERVTARAARRYGPRDHGEPSSH